MVKTRLRSSYNLPTDLLLEILPSLPVKSLLRFRSVSKTWRALINDPKFVGSYKNRPESEIYFHQNKPSLHSLDVRCSKTLTLNTKHASVDLESLPVLKTHRPRHSEEPSWCVVGSIDGLFMLQTQNNASARVDLVLWNPSIRKFRILPPPPVKPRARGCVVDAGLGFDPSAKDYKHVRFIVEDGDVRWVLVYTLGTNTWKATLIQGKGFSCPCDWLYNVGALKFVCFQGALYFLRYDSYEVASYDLSTNKAEFAYAGWPVEPENEGYMHYTSYALALANGGSSLALVSFKSPQGSIWLAEGLRGDITWSKRYSFASRIPGYDGLALCGTSRGFVYLNENDEMLLDWEDSVTSYDLKTRKETLVMDKGKHWNQLRAYPYVESLVLLN